MQSEGELRFRIFLCEIFVLRFQKDSWQNLYNSIEEYDPQTNKWRKVGKINLQIDEDNSFNNLDQVLFYRKKLC